MRLAPGPPAPALPGEAAPPPRSRPRPSVRPGVTAPAGPRPAREARNFPTYLAATLGGTAIALAWWVPETSAGALLGWIAAALLIWAARARRSYLPAYCCG